ncbi:MAG: GNAT family protein [Patescibacteria group bacterium]|nr:GNAT family protein [Patescibacteria group bacterium]
MDLEQRLSAPAADYVTPPGFMAIDYEVTLQRLEARDASSFYQLVDDNRAFLAGTLDWVSKYSHAQAVVEVKAMAAATEAGTRAPYKVLYEGKPVGFVNLHTRTDRQSQMGYWLAKQAQHKGIMSRATEGLRDFGFSQWGLEVINLHIRPDNEPSKRIAKQLGASMISMTKNANSGRLTEYEVWSLDKHDW